MGMALLGRQVCDPEQALSFLTKTPSFFPKSPHPPPRPSCRKALSSLSGGFTYKEWVGICEPH